MSDGKTVFIGAATDEDENVDIGYLSRAANDLLLFHKTLKDLEGDLVYAPPIKVGTKWQGQNSQVEVVAQETVSTPAGIFQNCFRIDVRIDDYYYDDYYYEYYSIWLANNVGPVKMAVIDVWEGDEEIEDFIVLTAYNTGNSVETLQGLSRF